MKNACGKDKGRTKQLAICLSSFLHRISDAVTTSSIPQHFSCQLSAPSGNPSSNEHRTSGQHPSPDPHPPLKPGRYEAGPTMCSTSRAVYLLIASLTIAHNNQLRHCQRNTHSWHRTRREVRVGCSVSSFLLIHRRQEFVLNPFEFPIIHVEQPEMHQTWCYLAFLQFSVPGNT